MNLLSRHEVIILPKKENPDYDEFKNMVRNVNMNEVSQEDFLSNSVYLFERKNAKLKVC